MGRVVGDARYYPIQIVGSDGKPYGKPAKLPSVSTILKALPKGGLDWYGYKMGLLTFRNELSGFTDLPPDDEALYEYVKELGRVTAADGSRRTPEQQVTTPYNALKKAGKRGTDVHDIAEYMVKQGKPPPKSEIPSEKIGYAEAMWGFWKTRLVHKPKVVAIEEQVFSLRHGFAGTFDVLLQYPEWEMSAVFTGNETGEFLPFTEFELLDWKTSKGIYESHLYQVTAYEYAAQERGWMEDDDECRDSIATVVRLGEDGTHETRQSDLTIEDFLAVKKVWEKLDAMNGGRW